MMVTLSHLMCAAASRSKAGIGDVPPGSAMNAPPRVSRALSMTPATSQATASAISAVVSYSCHSSSIMPAHSVALSQSDGGRRAPGPRGIGLGSDLMRDPAIANAVNPFPLRLDLVAPHEQGWVPFD